MVSVSLSTHNPFAPKNIDIVLNIHAYKTGYRSSQMAQCIKLPATQPEYLSCIWQKEIMDSRRLPSNIHTPSMA